MLRLIIAVSVVLLSGCASSDPTLADSVERKSNGVYKTYPYGYVNAYNSAENQCKIDGNKKMEIISTPQEYDYVSKRDVTVYVFRCID